MPEARTDREQKTDAKHDQQTQPSSKQVATREQQSQQLRRRSTGEVANPFDMVRRITEQMFGPLGASALHGLTRASEVWAPSIEVFERDGKLHVTADLPGMSKDDVRVELRDNSLIIDGERKQEKKEDREGYFVTERTYGNFYRVIPLPDDVNPDTARATFRDGVLDLTMDLPRDHRSHSKSIPIEQGNERSS